MDLNNWVNIATEVGAIDEDGHEFGSSTMACEAIEILLGKDNLKEAVRYYVAHKPGKELLIPFLYKDAPNLAPEEGLRLFSPTLSE